MKHAYVIFDRDGTLINHIHHLIDPDLIEFKNGLRVALQLLHNADFKFGIISNQSVIGRELATHSDVKVINMKIVKFLEPMGIIFDFIYYCPHLPNEGCKCRKPEIGLGQKAIIEHNLNPKMSFMVGDQESDMIFGKDLGCKTIQLGVDFKKSPFADFYSDTIEDAAKWILDERDRVVSE
jgi:histidinol-phosphate phosphatase family protein